MSETMQGRDTHPLRREVALLLQLAMVVFVWTVVIGVLSALKRGSPCHTSVA